MSHYDKYGLMHTQKNDYILKANVLCARYSKGIFLQWPLIIYIFI